MNKSNVARISASTSFSEEEVLALHRIFTLLRGGSDARIIARSKPIDNVMRKVQSMRGVVERLRAARDAGHIVDVPSAAEE